MLVTDASFGVRAGQFGFTITGASGLIRSSYFSDPQWANYPARFYHLRSLKINHPHFDRDLD